MRAPIALLTLTLVLASLLVPVPDAAIADGSNFYVDCSRPSTGSGSADAPWNRLEDVDSHAPFAAGDAILLRRGTTCAGILSPRGSGSAMAPITIGAWGSGSAPTVAGGGTPSWTGAVQLTDQQYWTVQDLHITNTTGSRSTSEYRSGVLVLNRSGGLLSGIRIQHLSIDHVTSSMSSATNGPRSFGGISVLTLPGTTGGFSGALIADNAIDHVGRTGIISTNTGWPAGRDVAPRITGNRVSWTRGDGIVLLGAEDGRIDHNVAAHASDEWPCEDCGPITPATANAAIWTGSSNRARIDHNEAYGTKWLGGDGEGFDVDSYSTDAVVEYNYAHDNEGGGILFCGSTAAIARYNILQNDKKSEIAFIGTAQAQRTTIANNTLYLSKRAGAGVVRTFGGHFVARVRFEDNLVYSYGRGGWGWPSSASTSGNTIVGRNGSGKPTDRTTRTSAPRLVKPGSGRDGISTLGGYRIRKGASNRTGTASTVPVTVDFFGKRVDPKHPPRGAAG